MESKLSSVYNFVEERESRARKCSLDTPRGLKLYFIGARETVDLGLGRAKTTRSLSKRLYFLYSIIILCCVSTKY